MGIPQAVVSVAPMGRETERREAATDDRGVFEIRVDAGDYEVRVESMGFITYRSYLVLEPNDQAEFVVELAVGSVGGSAYLGEDPAGRGHQPLAV